jgi:thioredoxin reductase (NADPH)
MLTIDDLRSVPLFSSLTPTDLDRLAETAADIHLAAGEFAVPEGGERALYAVLSGKIEVVKTIDGIERRLGGRNPGSIFGEVPLALGAPFPGGYRASEPSRVMRVEPRHYYALAASSPEFATKMGALARERLGGLQAIAAEPPKPRLTMIGHRSDPDCDSLRRFLTRNQVSFEWLTPDSPQLSAQWPAALPTGELYPVILADGTILHRPNAREVAGLVGLQTSSRAAQYDTMIIGGGPAGLAAAVYGASEGLLTLVIDARRPVVRLARPHASKTTWVSRTGCRETNWPAVRYNRRDDSERKFWSRAQFNALIRRSWKFSSTATNASVRGP